MAAINPNHPRRVPAPSNPIPSSSPAFGTPVHPVKPIRAAPIPAPPALKATSTILPIILPPATLRPLAFRTFTKKHNLTLTSSALQALATFIGRHCGSGWREEGLAERVLEEVARTWKKSSSQVIVDGESPQLKSILKSLEGCMSGGRIVQGKTPSLSKQNSFKFGADAMMPDLGAQTRSPQLESQTSFGLSSLEMEDEDEEEAALKDPREWLKVIGAFEQPRLVYNVSKKHFEKNPSKPSLLPSPAHKTEMFRQRYHIVLQRVLRNESFQTPAFSRARSLQRAGSISTNQTYKITPIANLLGRSGSTHLLLGLLTVSPTGTLALSDLTGSIALDLQHARPIPEDGAWFAPGMIVLVDGTYEEDYGNAAGGSSGVLGATGGIGGTIGGRFIGFTIGHPPCERRNVTLGIVEDPKSAEAAMLTGPAFGWTDFLGVGSERATGNRMRRIEQRVLGPDSPHRSNTRIAIAGDIHLDQPASLMALRTLLSSYASLDRSEYPLAIVLMGNFVSTATMAGVPGAGSLEYKEHFNALAGVLADFPQLIARTTLVFVPGDHDAWPSAFGAGAATPLPRPPVPDLFTNRIRRVVAEANREVHGARRDGREGEAVWTTNPSRLSWFGVRGEMVLLRDDMLGRLRRTAVRFQSPGQQDDEEDADVDMDPNTTKALTTNTMDIDPPAAPAAAPPPPSLDPDTLTARRLTLTLLSQAHLSPFPLALRPTRWDHANASLGLYPLPSALVLADAEAPRFALRYAGCCVLNPGRLVDGGAGAGKGGRAGWVEFDVREGRGWVRREG